MDFLDTLLDFFSRSPEETKGKTPEGACPNCWGRYQYDDLVRDTARTRDIDIIKGRKRQAFIREFMTEHIDGVRLHKVTDQYRCPRCKTVHTVPS